MTGRRSVIDPTQTRPGPRKENGPLTGFGTHLVGCTSDLVTCMSHLEDFAQSAHAPCRRPRACCGGSSTSWRFLCGSRAGLLVPLRETGPPAPRDVVCEPPDLGQVGPTSGGDELGERSVDWIAVDLRPI